MIVAPPTASGSSAATRLRKTKSESRKSIGNASSSARAMSSGDLLADLLEGELAAADRHARLALQRGPARGRASPSASVRKVADHVGGAAVLGDQRAVAAALVAGHVRRSRGPATPSRRGRASAAPARESTGAPSRTSATMSGDGARAGGALDVGAREHRLGLRVVEVVAGVEQPEHRAAEEAGGEHDDERAPQEAPAPAVDQDGEAVEHRQPRWTSRPRASCAARPSWPPTPRSARAPRG